MKGGGLLSGRSHLIERLKMDSNLKKQLQAIAQRRVPSVGRRNTGASREQIRLFYETAVVQAFGNLHRELSKQLVPPNFSHERGWFGVRIYQGYEERAFHYQVIARSTGSVRARLSVTDSGGRHSPRHKNLRGSKKKALAEITEDDILKGFVYLHERIFPPRR